jgi:cytochrome c-type biogenesis protein CcmH/NrfG
MTESPSPIARSAKQLEAAVAQDPSSDELHFYLGSAYDLIDRVGDAMKQYQAALERNPENYRANLLLGACLP